MRWFSSAAATVAGVLVVASAGPAIAAGPETVIVTGPTIIAFIEPYTDQQLERKPDAATVADDFSYYAGKVAPLLNKAHVDFHAIAARSFRLRSGKQTTIFRVSKDAVGYYLVAPGKKPHVARGVHTDEELIALARDYFNLGAPTP